MNYEKRIKRIRKQIIMRFKRVKKDLRYGVSKTLDGKTLQFSENSLNFKGIVMNFENEKNDSSITSLFLYNQTKSDGYKREFIPSNEFLKQYLYQNWIRAWLDDIEAFLRAWDLEQIRR